MTITLYNNSADTLHVDKSAYLSNAYTMNGTPTVVPQDVKAPVLDVEFTSTPRYNYAHIPEFGRYYYINNVEWLGGNVWRLFLTVDVLMSFKSEILATNAVVSRLEDKGLEDNYFIDDRLTAQASTYEDVEIKDMRVTSGGFNVSSGTGTGRFVVFSSNTHAGDSSLYGLRVTGGTLSPSFSSANRSYLLYITGTPTVTLTLSTSGFGPSAIITVNGTTVFSGGLDSSSTISIGRIRNGDSIQIRYETGALSWVSYYIVATENETEAEQ